MLLLKKTVKGRNAYILKLFTSLNKYYFSFTCHLICARYLFLYCGLLLHLYCYNLKQTFYIFLFKIIKTDINTNFIKKQMYLC